MFGPLKTRLINARSELENIVANNQSEFIESIDECVKEVIHNNNRIANANDSITFKAKFYRQIYSSVKNSKSIDFKADVFGWGIEYNFKSSYRYEVDKDLVDISALTGGDFSQLRVNCEKYLANSINIKEIELIGNANAIKVSVNLDDYLTKAARDFSHFVVAYLAKQGIKSSARQTNNEVIVVIERDTDTGGFEEI